MVQSATAIPANHGGACNQAVGSVSFAFPSPAARPPVVCFLCPIQSRPPAAQMLRIGEKGEESVEEAQRLQIEEPNW